MNSDTMPPSWLDVEVETIRASWSFLKGGLLCGMGMQGGCQSSYVYAQFPDYLKKR